MKTRVGSWTFGNRTGNKSKRRDTDSPALGKCYHDGQARSKSRDGPGRQASPRRALTTSISVGTSERKTIARITLSK